MIELRWRLLPYYKLDSDKPVEVKRVLQFRTQIMQMGRIPVGAGDGNTYVMHEKPMGWTWTEWKDVPEAQLDSDYDTRLDAAGDGDKR